MGGWVWQGLGMQPLWGRHCMRAQQCHRCRCHTSRYDCLHVSTAPSHARLQVCETLDTAAGIHENMLWAQPAAGAAGAASAAALAAAAAADDLLEQCEPCHKAEAGAAIRAAREEAANCSRLFAAHAEAAAAGTGNRNGSAAPLTAQGQGGLDDAAAAEADGEEQRRQQEWEAFHSLPAAERLAQLLAYLRDRHCYCLFCGCRYEDPPDMQQHCPGPAEADHE